MPPKITIIGLGLIGGSLGLALRRAQVPYEIVGHARHRSTTARARQRGAIDKGADSLPEAVDGAKLVIVATPPAAMEEVFRAMAPFLAPGGVVTDTASTKGQVMAWAAELLPAEVHFVGGHPMAGKETSGIDAAEADLFQGCIYCLVPSLRASAEAIEMVVGLVGVVSGRPYFVDAAEHDSFVAAISHLPFILSAALVNTTTASAAWREMGRLAAGGFRDTSRLAAGDPTMYRDICRTNRESILRWMDACMAELGRLRRLIEGGDEGLEQAFRQAKEAREGWEQLRREGLPPAERAGPFPSLGASVGHLFLGGGLGPKPRPDNKP